MEIIPTHYKISKPVKSYGEIKKEAEVMRRFIVRGQLKGYYNKAFAIAHCQISSTPYAFFVVSPDVMKEKMFKDDVIINPEIVEAPLYKTVGYDEHLETKGQEIKIPNFIEYQEPCLSFPFRTPKRLNRYDFIKVRYQVASFFGLKTVYADLQGIASQIFQHEYDHTQGKNIYFESESPVKWWELIGTDRSKGGTSWIMPIVWD
jgi:peptide deformylase